MNARLAKPIPQVLVYCRGSAISFNGLPRRDGYALAGARAAIGRNFTRLIYPIATHKPQFPQLKSKKACPRPDGGYRFSEKTLLMQKR
jgi:hypothetical protein